MFRAQYINTNVDIMHDINTHNHINQTWQKETASLRSSGSFSKLGDEAAQFAEIGKTFTFLEPQS